MMIKEIQPRPCTLWGQTFDANDFCEIHISPRYSSYRSLDVLSSDVTILACTRKEMPQGLSINPISADLALMKPLMNEAITAIHNALHPPLCMKHALELKAEGNQVFREKQQYLCVELDGNLRVLEVKLPTKHQNQFTSVSELYFTSRYGETRKPEELLAFIPVNKLGQPAHGEEESYVKACEFE